MTTLKQGDPIKDKNGRTCKVMEIFGELLFISFLDKYNHFGCTRTESQLKDAGYTWDTPAWEPKLEEKYWYIDDMGVNSSWSYWCNDDIDLNRRDFLGIYQTKELAEASLSEIRRKLGK